ncbi:MAG: hypothetical protein GY859_36245, partial [Desulfobacterales bacterium]|nr:hypothetical protein [Desulfobacterales bacterium]
NVLLILVLTLAGGKAEAGGKTTVVVWEKSNPFYEKVLDGFSGARGDAITIITTKEKDEKAVLAAVRQIRPRLILALGPGGLKKVRNDGGPPIIYAIVIKPREVIGDRKNIFGISSRIPVEKVMGVIGTAMPRVDKIGVLCGEDDWVDVERARAEAAKTGVSLIVKPLKGRAEILDSIREMRPHVQVLWIIQNRLFNTETVKPVLRLATELGIPAVSFADDHINWGAFITVSMNLHDVGRQAAELGEKALKGEQIPFTEPRQAVVRVSKKTALKLNIDFKMGEKWYLMD